MRCYHPKVETHFFKIILAKYFETIRCSVTYMHPQKCQTKFTQKRKAYDMNIMLKIAHRLRYI